jgi:hypothetical protein
MASAKSEAAPFQVMSFEDRGKIREYRKRKPHQKTALGCLPCKAKRVKVGDLVSAKVFCG